jgi:hypothetical protein
MKRTTEERRYITRHARLRKRYLLAPQGERIKRLAALKATTTEELKREIMR